MEIKDLKDKLEDILLCEMSNLKKDDTKLPYDLHVAQPGDKKYSHYLRVKVMLSDGESPCGFAVRPNIEIASGNLEFLKGKNYYIIKSFIEKYEQPIVDFWNGILSSQQIKIITNMKEYPTAFGIYQNWKKNNPLNKKCDVDFNSCKKVKRK